MSVDRLDVITKTVEVKGIILRWARWSYPAVFKDGKNLTPDRPDPQELIESGTVFIKLEDLYELAEQDRWDSSFGKVLLLGAHEGLALEQAGLAEQETRGGYHRTDKLVTLMERLES